MTQTQTSGSLLRYTAPKAHQKTKKKNVQFTPFYFQVRPPNQRELALPGGVVVEVGDDEQTVSVIGKPPFTLDVVFAMDCTQLAVFERIGVDIVKTAFHGYNASMFAYGQTSCYARADGRHSAVTRQY